MIWALLAFMGVPLWLCAAGIAALVFRNRALRKRHGDIPLRVLRPGKSRWVRGHAVWVGNVLAWRGSPAAWNEYLELVVGARANDPSPETLEKLHRLGDDRAVETLTTDGDHVLQVATTAEHKAALLGPYGEGLPTALAGHTGR